MEDWYLLLISCENWTQEEWEQYEKDLKEYGDNLEDPLFG